MIRPATDRELIESITPAPDLHRMILMDDQGYCCCSDECVAESNESPELTLDRFLADEVTEGSNKL